MKKTLIFATLAAALLSTAAMANPKDAIFTLTPPGVRTTPVDILVNNYTDQEIYITVPSRLMTVVYPGQAMHILKYVNEYTDLDLYSNKDYNFFMGTNLCPYAVVNVYSPTASGTRVDNNYCIR